MYFGLIHSSTTSNNFGIARENDLNRKISF